MILRPGNAGSNTAADQIDGDRPGARADPRRARRERRHPDPGRLGWRERTRPPITATEADLRFSFGYELTETVRTAILETPDGCLGLRRLIRTAASARTARSSSSQTASISRHLADGVARDRPARAPHPGAQLSFTDHDGHRFQAILTDQPTGEIAVGRASCTVHRARVEDRIRNDKDTGLGKLPFQRVRARTRHGSRS